MTSPSKRAKTDGETVVGHLYGVSQMKISTNNRRYFVATLQTGREDFNRVVCFCPEKRDYFVTAADNSHAVMLMGTQKITSYINPGGFDVLVSSQSRVDVSGDLPFPRRLPRTTDDRLSVADVLGLGPMQRVGEIDVRVLQVLESKVAIIQGAPVELKSFEVCDGTGQMGLAVWDQLISSVQPGQCYTFRRLTTRKEGDRIVLTTKPSSSVTATTGTGQPSSVRLMTVKAEETLRGPATHVQIVAKLRCPRCYGGQDQPAVKSTHRCERCALLQRTPAYRIKYSGLLIVAAGDGEERYMSLTNSAVFGFVRDCCVSHSAQDGPALEKTVMAMPELVVTINAEGLVVRFAPAVPDAEEASTSYTRDSELLGL